MSKPRSLATRLIFSTLTFNISLVAFLFIPAGTIHYWQAWTFIALLLIPSLFTSVYLLKHDPQLVERRMRTKEPDRAQKGIARSLRWMMPVAILIPGLDHRFGWSRVPLWLTIFSFVAVLAGYLVTLWVMRTNSFASRTVQVEEGQRVISTGPYRFVRHPMYFGIIVMMLFSPFALGSWWALPGFVLLVPFIVLRLLKEETTLRRDLPGYSDYCLRTRFRLVPLVW